MPANDSNQMPDFASPEFLAGVWQFIADVRAGTADDSPACYAYACWLTGFWDGAAIELYARAKGVSHAEAEAGIDELIRGQCAAYGALAAG
jgi:hypothetical protein